MRHAMILKQLREAKGLSQADVARELKVTPAAVGHWEQGIRNPSIWALNALADLYGVTVDALLGRSSMPA